MKTRRASEPQHNQFETIREFFYEYRTDGNYGRRVSTPAEAQPEAKPARKPRTRIQHERSRFVRAINSLRRELEAEFDAPDLLRLTTVSEDEFLAIKNSVINSIAASLGGVVAPPVKLNIEAELLNFIDWQKRKGGGYYAWSESEMDCLREALVALGDDFQGLFFCYAMSVGAKLKSGRLILIDRRGKETKS